MEHLYRGFPSSVDVWPLGWDWLSARREFRAFLKMRPSGQPTCKPKLPRLWTCTEGSVSGPRPRSALRVLAERRSQSDSGLVVASLNTLSASRCISFLNFFHWRLDNPANRIIWRFARLRGLTASEGFCATEDQLLDVFMSSAHTHLV